LTVGTVLAAVATMTDLEKRVRALKDAYVAAHRQAPIALYLTRADELAMREDPPSFLAPEAADKVIEGTLRVRKLIRKFLGLQVIWEADQTRVE
jgi:hypothetical protein